MRRVKLLPLLKRVVKDLERVEHSEIRGQAISPQNAALLASVATTRLWLLALLNTRKEK